MAMATVRATSGRSPVGFDGVALVPMGTGMGLSDDNARTNDYEEGNVEMVSRAAAAAAAKR